MGLMSDKSVVADAADEERTDLLESAVPAAPLPDDHDVEAGRAAAGAASEGSLPGSGGGGPQKQNFPPADPAEEEETPLVLVLLGRVGAGKSSTANTVCAGLQLEQPFEARRSASAVTGACRAESGLIADRQVLVLDTPGLGDAALTPLEVHNEIRRGITELSPAGALVCPLLILSLQSRVGEDDFAIVDGLKEGVFGTRMLSSSLVVWTHADALDGEGLEGYLQGAGDRLREFLAEVGGGSVALDNRMSQPTGGSTAQQVQDLVRQADAAAAKCYLVKQREPRTFGRRTARRQRQLEAGLLKPRPQSTGSCCVS